MKILFTQVSGNSKTGPIPVTYSPSSTCPPSCAFKGNGCYAEIGPTKMHWNRLDKGQAGIDWKSFLGKIKQLWVGQPWRHSICGDLPGEGERVDTTKLAELVRANRGKKGWTYTHKSVLIGKYATPNRKAIAHSNQNGFTVNLSANNLHHADTLAKLGIGPVVSVVPSTQLTNTKTPEGRRVVICPAVVRDNVTCFRCSICHSAKRDYIVGFPSHGIRAKTVDKVVMEGAL
jgi:hypothetical protein